MKKNSFLVLLLTAVFVFAAAVLAQEEKPQEKLQQPETKPQEKQEEKPELLKYVEKDDKAFKWEKAGKTELGEGTAIYELKMTSQVWQKIEWKHTIHVVTPKEIKKKPTHVFLLIVGSGRARMRERMTAGLIANQVGAPVAVLYDIPNQPLFGKLREDGLIAYTFTKYRETKDASWLLLFPMTKAAVKAMDAVEEFLEKELKVKTAGFVTSGASKRGWTTWLTAAVDKRVKAIAPMVYDNLDLCAQMKHQKEHWGDFSKMIAPYTKQEIPQKLLEGDEDAKKLAAHVDPFAYRDRITVPKLILIGTNDPYWPLDAANLYWDKLKGEKYLLYVPNAGHGLNAGIFNTIIAFFKKTQGELKFHEYEWSVEDKGMLLWLTVHLSKKPAKPKKWKRIQVWVGTSATKDFRKADWRREWDAFQQKNGDIKIPAPKELGKYVAVFGEVTYKHEGLEYILCSNVKIFPPLKKDKEKKEEKKQEKEK
jgi:PhoPQ-activated pathogenicity-related protein